MSTALGFTRSASKLRSHSATPQQSVVDFAAKIEQEFCQGSAIAPSLYNVSIDIIEDTGRWEPNEALNQRVSRFWETARPHSFGEIAMFRQESGEYWQGKAQRPRIDKKKNTLIKYETPVGNGYRAYLPTIDRETRKAISQRYGCVVPSEGSFWNWLHYHPTIPVIFTEGGKKALALLSQGYVAIALFGINGGYRANDRIGADIIPLAKPELTEDIKRFVIPGRCIVLAFDQDIKESTRAKVTSALFKFGGLLKAAGADVAIASWDPSQGKGIDDLIVNCGGAAATKAIDEAVSFDQWAIERRLSQRVRRKPDLNIGNREFVEVADSLPQDRDIAFFGGKGTAKSQAIAKLLDGKTWLSLTSLQSLARAQAEGWNGAFINDSDRYGNRFLKDGQPVDGGSACIPSLLKVKAIDADVLVIDEVTAVLAFLHSSPLANKEGTRPILLTEFERRVRSCEQVIIADADMTEEVLSYLEAIRGKRFYLVRSERKPLRWTAHLIEKRNAAIPELLKRVETLPDGKLLYVNCDEKSRANAIAAVLEGMGIKSLLITQDTSGGMVEQNLLTSKGRSIPSLIQEGIRAIVTSPSVVQGFSIEHHTDLVDSVWGIYAGTSISADAIAQALDRVRAPIDRFVYVPKRGRSYSKLSKALNQRQFISEFKSASTCTARLARLSLRPETNAVVDGIDWQGENIKLLASFEVSRNQGMVALQDTVCALLRHEGKTIQAFKSKLDKAAFKAASDAIAQASRAAEEAWQIAVSGSESITDEEATALEKKTRIEPLTQTELHQLEKHYLAKFYRLDEVEQGDVAFDQKGRTRQQIRNLEALLDEATAQGRSAKSIDTTPTTPQDWDKAVLRRWLLTQTGAADFLLGVWDGSIVDLTGDIVEPLATKLKAHSVEFKIAFGFSNLDQVSDMQAIATLMDAYGLKRTSHKHRVAKKIIRSYFVDTEHLEKLKSIVICRNQSVATPQTDLLNGGGATPLNPDEWLSPASLADVRMWHETALSNPNNAGIAKLLSVVPPDVLRWATT